jgi:hypothetical protein
MPNRKKLTRKAKRRLLELLGEGKTLTAAAAELGVSRECVRLHRRQSARFDRRVRKAVAEAGLDFEIKPDPLYEKAMAGDFPSMRKFLVERSRHLPPLDPNKWYYPDSDRLAELRQAGVFDERPAPPEAEPVEPPKLYAPEEEPARVDEPAVLPLQQPGDSAASTA